LPKPLAQEEETQGGEKEVMNGVGKKKRIERDLDWSMPGEKGGPTGSPLDPKKRIYIAKRKEG